MTANDDKIFNVDGFGQVGAANLLWFVPLAGEKPWQNLAINEATIGMAKGDLLRVVRIK